MAELDRSVARVLSLLRGQGDTREVLALTTARRSLDLSDLTPDAQAALLAERTAELRPSREALAERLATGRPLVVKFTVEPFATDFHLGNVVPLLLVDRLRRMKHEVVFIVGDITAIVGDASGSTKNLVTDTEIARNLAAYRCQVERFVDFDSIQLRHNADWLRSLPLPRLLALAAHIPVDLLSQGTTLAQLLYPLMKAVDSIETGADIEVGGTYQTHNMDICRHLMAAVGTEPEIALSTPLITGVDGESLMSAARNNQVSLTAPADEVFQRISSIPHGLVTSYLRALTEWRDVEIEAARAILTPEELRALAAADITAALHGLKAAEHEWLGRPQ